MLGDYPNVFKYRSEKNINLTHWAFYQVGLFTKVLRDEAIIFSTIKPPCSTVSSGVLSG